MLEGALQRSGSFDVIPPNFNLFEGPKCKKCGNAADTQISGIWYCEECAPDAPVFKPRIVH